MIDYLSRRQKIYDTMAREGIALLAIEDTEGRRNPALRWLCGHPQDALLFLSVDKKSLLVPWDANMALLYSKADVTVPYREFDRQPISAVKGVAEKLKMGRGWWVGGRGGGG
ncbi:MAG: aminopeptidase P family N-terminal domain-containing protein, partial [Treponema sp.]|nr:aminopeptidase P family N-terminal domain-containing protein [Treponema sp.]